MKSSSKIIAVVVAVALIAVLGGVLAGCSGSSGGSSSSGKPTFVIFMSKSSKSYDTMKPILDKMMVNYKGKVVFKYYDYDAPGSAAAKKQYNVSMNPTFIILNTQGKIKEIYMGAMQEEMLTSSLDSFIPGAVTTSAPGTQQGQPITPGSSMPVNVQTLPVTPGSGTQTP
jgi:ABC-type glycerol-3-phosphate transport system substrate-binding protein